MCFAFYWFCCTYFQQRSWIWTAFSVKLNGGDTRESEGRAEDLVARASWFVGNQHQDSGVVVLLLAQAVVCFCFVFCSDSCVWGLALYHYLAVISLLLFWLQAPVPCSWLGFSCCKVLVWWIGRGWIFVSWQLQQNVIYFQYKQGQAFGLIKLKEVQYCFQHTSHGFKAETTKFFTRVPWKLVHKQC